MSEDNTVNETNQNKVTFQIPYCPEEKKDEFKEWAHKRGLSMKTLLYALLDNKAKVDAILDADEKRKE